MKHIPGIDHSPSFHDHVGESEATHEGMFMDEGSTLLLFALSGGAMQAQDRGQEQDHHDQTRNEQNQSNQYRDDRRGQDPSTLDDHDRQTWPDWYNEHHDHPPVGVMDRERLTPEYESRLREGDVLDRDMRRRIHPVPAAY
jgi:hypothetical protein